VADLAFRTGDLIQMPAPDPAQPQKAVP